jgi:transcriptional regulator with XRE-family HTH domain
MDDVPSFGRWLQRRRKALDLTQAELAEHVGYSKETIRKIEADALRPSKELAAKLAARLGIAPTEREDFVRFARDGQLVDETSLIGHPTVAVPQQLPPRLDRHNLPVAMTSFVGRERAIADVARLLDAGRLVTLTGTGGCGKTRLALHIVADRLDRYPDGVWLVELAPLADATLVPDLVAAAVGARGGPGQPIQATLLLF